MAARDREDMRISVGQHGAEDGPARRAGPAKRAGTQRWGEEGAALGCTLSCPQHHFLASGLEFHLPVCLSFPCR